MKEHSSIFFPKEAYLVTVTVGETLAECLKKYKLQGIAKETFLNIVCLFLCTKTLVSCVLL